MVYVCFIVDAFSRRIVGWRVAANMRTEMVLDALEMARRSRGGRRLVGLVAHSDAGSQFTSVRFTERLDEVGARPSIGTVADSFDNALAETTNGLYNAECVLRARHQRLERRRRPRARHPHLGALVQRTAAPQSLRRHAASRVRSNVLRCPTGRPRRGSNPIARVSIRPRAAHFSYGRCRIRTSPLGPEARRGTASIPRPHLAQARAQ